jgi:outer membrane lipoprotein-sorting protein
MKLAQSILPLTFALLLACPFAAAAEDLADVEKKIIAKWDTVKAFTGKMKMTGKVPMETSMDGDVEFVRAGEKQRVRMDMTMTMTMPGQGEMKTKVLMVSDGEIVTSLIDAMGRKMATKTRADSPQQQMNMDFGGKAMFDQMRKQYDLTLAKDAEIDGETCWSIEGTLKEPQPNMPVKYVSHFRQKDGMFVKQEGFDKDEKSIQVITVTDIKLNPKIDAKRFELEIPEGVQVMDMTKGMPGGGTP